jgi:hypothetical protein
MDGRIDMYPDEVWSQYVAVTAGQSGWEQLLDKHRVNYLVLDKEYHAESGLLAQVRQSSRWDLVSAAGDALLFARREMK